MTPPDVTTALHALGWTVVLALWQTAGLALLVWGWSRLRPRAAAQRHALALGALVTAVGLASATFAVLVGTPARTDRRPPHLAESSVVSALADGPQQLSSPRSQAGTLVPSSRSAPVTYVAVLWLAGVGLLLARVCGGLVVVRRLHARADRVHSRRLTEMVRRLSATVEHRQAVDLLESSKVDAPVAVGWRRPAVILPTGLEERLPANLIEPLLAHELEHLRRNDPVMAAVQATAEALLFCCPGSHWLSRYARLAREQSCDDAALEACGDRDAYVAALVALAGAGRAAPAVAALGAGAPSLSQRIRRILKGDDMRALSRTQTAFLLVAFGALTASGVAVGSAALDDPAAHRAAAGLPSRSPGPPTGYVQQQPGAPVTITRTSPGNGMVFDRVRVRNISEERITSVTFAAVIPDPLRSKPAIVVRSAPIETSLGPGEAAELSAQLLSMRELEGRPKPGPATMLGVVETRLAVSGKWTVRLRTDARDALEAFLLPGPFLSKALVGAERQAGSNENLCLDDRGFAYSEGGIVPVHDGPPIWARCDRGVWQPHELETRPASEH